MPKKGSGKAPNHKAFEIMGSTGLSPAELQLKTFNKNWDDLRVEYLENDKLGYYKIAHKYGLSERTVCVKARREGWRKLKDLIHYNAEKRMLQQVEDKLVNIKMRHSELGKKLQKAAEEAIDKGISPAEARDVVKWLSEGVKIEREAEGVSEKKDNPGIVNIINQQQAVLDKYAIKPVPYDRQESPD